MLLPYKKKEEKKEENFNLLLFEHVKIESKLLNLFKNREDIEYNQLIDLLNEMKNIKEETITYCNFSDDFEEDKKDKYEEDKEEDKDLVLIKEREIPSTLIDSFKNLKREIYNACQNDVPNININNISKFIELFEREILKEKEVEEREYIFKEDGKLAVLQSKDGVKIPLCLKNGKRIVLTDNKFDLSEFTYDQLIEILRVLDVMINDNRFDNLRDEIVKQIESISQVSQI